MKLIILGATGGTGQQLVRQALEQGHLVTAFVRSPEKLNPNDSNLSVIMGDVLDRAAVERAIQGHDAVLVALGVKPPSRKVVVGPGTQNILAAMKEHGVRRIIVESAMFMDDGLRQRSFLTRLLVATLMKGLYRDKLVQEKAVMESGLDWVIVRPTALTNGAKSGWLICDPREVRMTSRISRANVADFMLKQVKDNSHLRRARLLETVQNQYIPGVCNIGDEEIERRKQAGWTGLALTIVLWGIFVWLDAAPVWRLLLFFPAMISATGFLQAYMHFCAYFGFAALFNLADVGKTDSVQQAEFRAKDRRKAWQIVIYSAPIGIAVAALAYSIHFWR